MAMRVTLAVSTFVLFLAIGCAAKPEIVPSAGPRPPTQAEQVKIYQKQPLRYEKLGVVSLTVPGDAKWDEGGNFDAAFDNLKAQAAARGANGLLPVVDDGKKYG